MRGQTASSAADLVAQARREQVDTAAAIRSHRFLERLRIGDVSTERLSALAGEQHAIVSSDRRSCDRERVALELVHDAE
jgi:LDH2 family malate/lactate/ureidoglycolate dehydrogenase